MILHRRPSSSHTMQTAVTINETWRMMAIITTSVILATAAGADPTKATTLLEGGGYTGSSPSTCVSGTIPFDSNIHKRTYRVGVHAIRGFEAAQREYQKGYSEYLTMTAGQRFDPPIRFEMIPMTFEDIFKNAYNEELDFMFANPSVYSCIGTEEGASPLATIVSRVAVRGHTYDLDVFGGVMATRWDNDDINNIEDLKDKVIGAGSISMVMAGQLQFHEMEKAGISYVMDPKQVVLTYNQFDVVHGIVNGRFDVGFVRTDTIERTTDDSGKLLDPDLFKIIEPKIYIVDDGNLFPFLHSTPIYPEWPFAALSHVPNDVAEEVQNAILAIGKHADVGRLLQECREQFGNKTCAARAFPKEFNPHARCDTTIQVAELALEATLAGQFSGFRTARSYFEPRIMLQDAGFMKQDARGHWHCTRASNLYDGIDCPAGHYKRTRREFDKGCDRVGLPCEEGYDCFCKPCIKAFEVDVYPVFHGVNDSHISEYYGEDLIGCEKMSVCAVVEQTKYQTFRIYDNKERENAALTVKIHVGKESKYLEVMQVPNVSWAYEFNVSEAQVGVEMLEIFINGEHIPESPIRVQVVDRNCDTDYGLGSRRGPDDNGVCVCANGTIEISNKCVTSIVFFVVIAIAILIITSEFAYLYLGYKKRQGDTVWLVNVDELHFTAPLEIIGQGAFGVVLLAEYRGTKVAVKRVLPQKQRKLTRSDRSEAQLGDCNDTNAGTISKGDSPPNSRQSSVHVEAPQQPQKDPMPKKSRRLTMGSRESDSLESITDRIGRGTDSSESLGDFIGHGNYGQVSKKSWFALFSPCFPEMNKHGRLKNSILGNDSESRCGTSSATFLSSVLPRCDKQSKLQQQFVNEMRLLSRLRHPCINTVMGAVISPVYEPMLVMEYMEYGSLHDLLRNETMYTGGEVILQIVRDIAQGLRYLHASKPPILHGDLKAKNILIDSRFRAKVADFGLSEKTKHGISGTPLWMAPEYLRGKTDYNVSCDMYSLGIILYEIYARKSPYEGEDLKVALRKTCDPRHNRRPPVPESCPPKMADIMKKCWSPDPFFRPSSKDLDLLLMDFNMQDAEPLDSATAFKNTRKERATGDMLYDLFPKHIADALNAGQKVEPQSHELVTVIFSDIVGFTDISGSFSPLKVSQMLDRLYVCFDTLARKHDVFKVETIGDAYMGVTNLDGSQDEDHVKKIAEFASDLVDGASKILIDEEEPDRGFVEIRVGFHSGPVVSNVIGSLNPRYGLFGDTVNTASRMESNSKAGRILCTERSAHLLQKQAPDIKLAKRGKIDVKGKGDMTTYWVGSHHGSNHTAEIVRLSSHGEVTPTSKEVLHV